MGEVGIMTTLYHVTREAVSQSIWGEGVSPAYSTGRNRVSWWVDLETVYWALAHVSARWDVPVNKLIVCEASIPASLLHKWMRPGIYFTHATIKPQKLHGYEQFLKPESLSTKDTPV